MEDPTPTPQEPSRTGRLLLVATPIGNLGDITTRARDALATCDLVACEDTRRTGRLMAHLGLKRPLLSVHDHNERQRVDQLMDRLARGETVALVSDAGTPLVSDPGYRVVKAAISAGHLVHSLPGPAAFLSALVLSGLPPTPFTFAGFPPPKSGKRRRFFEQNKTLPHTLVLYESPHRIGRTLADALEILGDRQASLSRELTKLHEETLRGTLSNLVEEDQRRKTWKGEIVLSIAAS